MTDQPTESELKPFRSYALWPEGTPADSGNLSWDFHETREQASAVCNLLEQNGFGGDGKVFPIKTWVEDHSRDSRPAETELQSLRSEVERLREEWKKADQRADALHMQSNRFESERDTLKSQNAELVKALETLKKWNESPSVLGTGDYDQGLCCGVEDRGLQTNGYEAMRFGYDAALERVAEEIDGVIANALAKTGGAK